MTPEIIKKSEEIVQRKAMLWSQVSPAGILCDRAIKNEVGIFPMVENLQEEGVVSYGLTTAGYDARLGDEVFLVQQKPLLPPEPPIVIDPKAFQKDQLLTRLPIVNGEVLMPPHSFVLAKTVEYFALPRNVKGLCNGKSTYARCGITTIVTPLEPGWHGQVTVEIHNCTPQPAKLYIGEGIMQVEFHMLCAEPRVSYADRKGKYQGQTGVQPPFVKGKE